MKEKILSMVLLCSGNLRHRDVGMWDGEVCLRGVKIILMNYYTREISSFTKLFKSWLACLVMEINVFYLFFVVVVLIVVAYFIGRRVKAGEIKGHRADAVLRSRAVITGNISEQLAPYLPGFNYNPNDCRFIGKPIDFIVFKGMNEKDISEVVFVEVKSGKSKVSSSEKKLKDAIDGGRVRWEEYRFD